MNWVLDTSVTMAWCFDDERTAKTDELLDQLAQNSGLVVPQIWSLEVANVLLTAAKKGRITPAKRRQFLTLLESARISVDMVAPNIVFNEVFNLADKYQLISYDASYLELAMRRGLPLATLDKALKRAAMAAGISILT